MGHFGLSGAARLTVNLDETLRRAAVPKRGFAGRLKRGFAKKLGVFLPLISQDAHAYSALLSNPLERNRVVFICRRFFQEEIEFLLDAICHQREVEIRDRNH